jgi:hypothetical protein
MAIVGNGDIASILEDRDDLILFASGVSNSMCIDEREFDREVKLLLAQPRGKRLVYFSSLAVFYSDTRYTEHKRDMEEIIKEFFPKYCIIRIGNITFGTNPNTIINFFKKKLTEKEEPEIREGWRYLIDREELLHWVNLVPTFNCEMNCPGWRVKISEIWKMVQKGNL